MLDGIAKHGPDLGPDQPPQRATPQYGRHADRRRKIPRYRRRDGRVLEERRDDDEEERAEPEAGCDGRCVERGPLALPRGAFAVD